MYHDGHLENSESARMVRDHASDRLQMLLLSHLSQDNNRPDIALSTARKILLKRPHLKIHVAPRDAVSPLIENSNLRRPRPNRNAVNLRLLRMSSVNPVPWFDPLNRSCLAVLSHLPVNANRRSGVCTNHSNT